MNNTGCLMLKCVLKQYTSYIAFIHVYLNIFIMLSLKKWAQNRCCLMSTSHTNTTLLNCDVLPGLISWYDMQSIFFFCYFAFAQQYYTYMHILQRSVNFRMTFWCLKFSKSSTKKTVRISAQKSNFSFQFWKIWDSKFFILKLTDLY